MIRLILIGLLLVSAAPAFSETVTVQAQPDNDMLQWLLNAVFAIAGAWGGWLLKLIHQAMRDLQQADKELATKVQQIEVLVAGQYVKKDELERLSIALFSKLDRIESKLDTKMDKD